MKTTEIRITSELAELPDKDDSTYSFALNENGRVVSNQSFDPYSVSIGACPPPDITSPQSLTYPKSPNSMKFGADKNAKQRKAAMEANQAAFSYCKCAILFFLSLLITWVPSSINRVYSLIHPDIVSFPLLYISAFVLPLQGFWNAVIYIATSLPACQALFSQMVDSWAPETKIVEPSPCAASRSPKRSTGSSADSMQPFTQTGR